MLNLFPADSRNCQGVSRRAFLRVGALAGLGLSLPALLAGRQKATAAGKQSKDVSCILIWTRGRTSHHHTSHPAPDAPASVRGELGTVATAVPGVRFCDVTPRMARDLRRFGLLRSLNPRNGSHGSADAIMMSGHAFNPNMVYPCFGSII